MAEPEPGPEPESPETWVLVTDGARAVFLSDGSSSQVQIENKCYLKSHKYKKSETFLCCGGGAVAGADGAAGAVCFCKRWSLSRFFNLGGAGVVSRSRLLKNHRLRYEL